MDKLMGKKVVIGTRDDSIKGGTSIYGIVVATKHCGEEVEKIALLDSNGIKTDEVICASSTESKPSLLSDVIGEKKYELKKTQKKMDSLNKVIEILESKV